MCSTWCTSYPILVHCAMMPDTNHVPTSTLHSSCTVSATNWGEMGQHARLDAAAASASLLSCQPGARRARDCRVA